MEDEQVPPSLSNSQLEYNSVIIRYGGEIGIKGSWTRRLYERRLLKNMKNVLKHHEIPYSEIVRRHGRFYLRTASAIESSLKLSKAFGISSLSPSLETTSKLNDIVERSIFLAKAVMHKGNSFAVKCRRVGAHPYTSADICRQVGRQILERFPELNLEVDLKHPDMKLGIEVRNDRAFIYTNVIEGVGGLPLGTQPKVVCLLTGCIDSLVAGWLVMKRGCPIVPLYFDNSPVTDQDITARALNMSKVLFGWALGFPRKVYVVQHGQTLIEILDKCPENLTCLLCRRMMYRVAERIADVMGAEGIVTGEVIGEQSSQTLRSLRILSNAATSYPIHRPILGLDPLQRKRIAMRIGIGKLSVQRMEGCAAVPRNSINVVGLEEVVGAEERFDIEKMIRKAIKSLKVVEL